MKTTPISPFDRHVQTMTFGNGDHAILLDETMPGSVSLRIRIQGDAELPHESEGTIHLLPEDALFLADQLVAYVEEMEARAWDHYVESRSERSGRPGWEPQHDEARDERRREGLREALGLVRQRA